MKSPRSEAQRARDEPHRFVTVAAFHKPVDAYLARAFLDSQGIECVLLNEHIGWLYGSAAGGVRLAVRGADHERARHTLGHARPSRPSASADFITADLDAPRCPACGSLRVGAAALTSWLPVVLPPRFGPRRASCRSCGARWKRR